MNNILTPSKSVRKYASLSLTSLALLLTSSAVSARQLEPEACLQRFLADVPRTMQGPAVAEAQRAAYRLAYTERSAAGNCFYVFERGEGAGFVILGADDVLPEVLGYADGGAFSTDNMPDGLRYWLDCVREDAERAISSGVRLNVAGHPSRQRERIEPLCGSLWAQTSPYNDDCPRVNDRRAQAGCVAVAMGQVMFRHKWPEHGTGSHSYKNNVDGSTVSADFNTDYDWSKIRHGYGAVSLDGLSYIFDDYIWADFYEEAAVSKLLFHCGVSVGMQYDKTGSGSDLANAVYAMTNYFGYDLGAKINGRGFFSNEAWTDLIYTEIAEGRPVIYGGASSLSNAHAFVVDGYDGNGMFHVNWGWAGIDNGYFAITGSNALHPSTVENGYVIQQRVITGLQPKQEGSRLAVNLAFYGDAVSVCDASGRELTYVDGGGNASLKSTGTLANPLRNMTAYECKGCFGARFEDVTTGAVYHARQAGAAVRSIVPDDGYTGSYEFTTEGVPGGTYRVSYAFCTDDGVWYDVAMPYNMALPLLTVGARTLGEGGLKDVEAMEDILLERRADTATGDVNGDGRTNIADMSALVHKL